jgi:hypothetical protein
MSLGYRIELHRSMGKDSSIAICIVSYFLAELVFDSFEDGCVAAALRATF